MDATSHSLLDQVKRGPQGFAWQRWHALYEPLIRGWLRRHDLLPDDRDDLVQETLAVVVRRLPEFEHNGRIGAFRLWLKTIAINCLRDDWKKRKTHPKQPAATALLNEWADESGELSREWDREHDRHLLQKLLAMLQPEFEPATWNAFQQLVLENKPAAEVAVNLKITPNAVYIAKSRVLTRLRQEAAGLVDVP